VPYKHKTVGHAVFSRSISIGRCFYEKMAHRRGSLNYRSARETEWKCRFHLTGPLERPAWRRPRIFEAKMVSKLRFASSTDSHGLVRKQNGNQKDCHFRSLVQFGDPRARQCHTPTDGFWAIARARSLSS
jgi:hypothetical protein